MRNVRRLVCTGIVFSVVFLCLFSSCRAAEKTGVGGIKAAEGSINLEGMKESEYVKLDGEWSFWWQAFITPASIGAGKALAPDCFGPVPGDWSSFPVLSIAPTGFGTYALKIKGLQRGQLYGLKLTGFSSAARIYANGILLDSQGVPSTYPEGEKPTWANNVIPVAVQGPELDLVIHISNWSDRKGGPMTSILFGGYEKILTIRENAKILEIFFAGAIVIMGLHFLSIHLFRRKEKASLYFGFLGLALALRILCYDELFILNLLPDLPWQVLVRLGFLMFTIPATLFAAFVRALYPSFFRRAALLLMAILSGIYSLFIIFAPTILMARVLVFYQIVVLLFGTYIIYIIVRAMFARENTAFYFSGGFMVFFLTIIHDILVTNNILPPPFITQFGVLGFLFLISLVITKKYSLAFEDTERMASRLSSLNASLNRFVPREFLNYLGKKSIEDIELGDHAERHMAILFADIRGYTGLSEKFSPGENFDFINAYLAMIGPVIREHGGFVDKYMGDGIMALFPDSADNALRCAIEMQKRLIAFNAGREMSGKKPLVIGIGVNIGMLMLGTIGDSGRMDGTVISDAVNLASRLEGLAKEFSVGIAMSENILKESDDLDSYNIRYLGKIVVRGKKEPLAAYECYDGDTDSVRAVKDSIKSTFEKAIADFNKNDFEKAKTGFEATLDRLPKDDASHYYLRMIRKMSE